MHRDFVPIGTTILLLAFIGGHHAEAKLCHSMDIRNDPKNLEKLNNCTVIVGFLKILLFDSVETEAVFAQHSYPQLTEITEYLLVFRVRSLTSLGTLFPNLRVIRGSKLLHNYALVVFSMQDLREIGLTNLRYIKRGRVKVDSCPQLCFVDTIDWKRIGASKLDFTPTNFGFCETCSLGCNEHCWNSMTCQHLTKDNCSSECIGCTKNESASHCQSCRNYEDDGTCVEKCPPHKFSNDYIMKCVTKEECSTLLNGTWWIFNSSCVQACPIFYEITDQKNGGCTFCGENCTVECVKKIVTDKLTLEDMAPCTIINGYLEIRISNASLEPFLEENLGRIKEIRGYLKIARSNAVRSLAFLKKLQIIGGEQLENGKYSLIVYDNKNLQSLWNFTDNFQLDIQSGTIAFHDNDQLCFDDIEHLVKLTGKAGEEDMKIFRLSNGENAPCNIKDLQVTLLEINPTNVTLTWMGAGSTNDTIIGYTMYYIETFDQNITTLDSKDQCQSKGWESIFVSNNTLQLVKLKPHTQYGYYIKIYSTNYRQFQTSISFFTTISDDPSEPINFVAISETDSTVKLLWSEPMNINGEISHYSIVVCHEKDYLPIIQQRNYCQYPHTAEGWEIATETPPPLEEQPKSNCSCKIKEEVKIFQHDIARLCQNEMTSSDPTNACKNFLYHVDEDNYDDIQQPPHETRMSSNDLDELLIKKRHLDQILLNEPLTEDHTCLNLRSNDPNDTTFQVRNLTQYSLYIFLLRACNKDRGDQCGPVVLASVRTQKKETANRISDLVVKVEGKSAFFQWKEPTVTNSYLVAYHIEYKREDLEHSKAVSNCITRNHFVRKMYQYQLLQLAPGKYSIRVQATSLAGPGDFSASISFEIGLPSSRPSWLYILLAVLFLVVIAVVSFAIHQWYRKKHALDNIHLITRINPDYAGPIYEEDEWEIPRADIEILKELGQGSFGMVYEGVIKSRKYRCAIKTVNESATMPSRMEFLNEGSIMKTFNDAYHVIRLLGIVSRGQPPLVVMELMERGDLKTYLRRCRGPSQNLTTNELYRMAVEIADGMAYLSAKKFVHRDLAARNCMVAANRTVKVGDFGMARDIYETDYYRKETVGLLPVRWMSPESLADGVFTTDSDVWSYGIVLWEMATLAEQPYQGLSNEEVFHFVKNRGKLERPNECSDLMYEVMDACWLWRPNDRPTFSDIVDKLVDHVGEDFRLVAFCYSKQGLEHALHSGPRVFNPPAMSEPVPRLDEEDELCSHYDVSEEEVSLYTGQSTSRRRPSKYLHTPNQRYSQSPYHISPGSPSSGFSLDSS